MLSPMDWNLIESWKTRGIPLHLVIGSIEEVFRNRAGQVRPVRNGLRLPPRSNSGYAEWLQTQVGKGPVEPAEGGSDGLLRLAIGAIDLAMSVEGLSFSQSVDRLRELADSNLGGLSIAEVAVQYFKQARGLEYEAKAEASGG